MIKECKLGSISTMKQILALLGKKIQDLEYIETEPTEISAGYRVFEYNFKIVIPALHGYFRMGFEKEEHFPGWALIGNVLHFYEMDADTPTYSTHDDLCSFVTSLVGIIKSTQYLRSMECRIEMPDAFENVIRCKVPDADQLLLLALKSIDRSIEKNSIGSPNLNFETYKYDMTIRIPQLHVYFKRYTDLNLRTLYLTDFGMPYFKLYDQGTGDVISSDKKVTMRECLEEIYQAEDLSELECIIEMPYRFHIFE